MIATIVDANNISAPVIAGVATFVAAVVAVAAYRYQRKEKKPLTPPKALKRVEISVDDSGVNDDGSKNVWAARQRLGVSTAATTNSKVMNQEGKKFGSSYYYAHNNSKAAGGYKDGLRMEDFHMNGPRLLSRSGNSSPALSSDNLQSLAESNLDVNESSKDACGSVFTVDVPPPALPPRRIISISKYFWDDPGDTSTGIATIWIEELPSPESSSVCIGWKDLVVDQVSATLPPALQSDSKDPQQGLTIVAQVRPKSTGNEALDVSGDDQRRSAIDYRLHIPHLYGPVDEVKTILKPDKRLLVKLYKTKKNKSNSNLWKAKWPHPQKK
jgi:hypothetical protein